MRLAVRVFLVILGLIMVALVAGYAVLLRPDIPYDVLEHRYANKQSRFIDLPGGYHIHYRDQGNHAGRTLLLIHGFGVSLETWEPWVKLLWGKYRIVSLDLPGHGLTRAPDVTRTVGADADLVAAFAEAIHLPPAIVAGNSRGGAVAWNLALYHPDRVAGLVLIDSSGFEWQRPRPPGMASVAALLGNPIIGPLLHKVDKSRMYRQILAMAYHDKHRVTDAMATRYIEFSRAPGHREILDRAIVETINGVDRTTLATRETLAHIRAPTLILWGAKDEMESPGDAKKFADAIAGATLIVYPESGHVPMEEAATQSARDLDRWIGGLK
jgi:pimeloyl-ACP methyl ester carboxylesterase